MIKEQRRATVSGRLIVALFVLTAASLGCNMLGGRTQKNTAADTKNSKGIPANTICQMLAHPSFENRFPYNGEACSGSTYFGARDTRTGSYETDTRPSFSYAAIGEQDLITKVRLNMTKRPDGAEFFAAVGDGVAKLINGKPLPDDIRNTIMTSLVYSPLLGDKVTTTSQVGNAKVEVTRSATDSTVSLSFDF
ncbi:MAG: hypothetical protein ACRD6N_17535 [Pyrinomonadaceae bacterium]